jgi:hypothetical protein
MKNSIRRRSNVSSGCVPPIVVHKVTDSFQVSFSNQNATCESAGDRVRVRVTVTVTVTVTVRVRVRVTVTVG